MHFRPNIGILRNKGITVAIGFLLFLRKVSGQTDDFELKNMTTDTAGLKSDTDDYHIGWSVGVPVVFLLVILPACLVLIFKCSSHYHACRVRRLVSNVEKQIKEGTFDYFHSPDSSPGALRAKASSSAKPKQLRILSLNMFLRPWGIADDSHDDYKDERLNGFCDHYLDSYDILCFQECFSTLNHRKLRLINTALRRGFHYFAESPPPAICSNKFVDGGLLILSRLPFDGQPIFKSYTAGTGADRMADKGVLHVCLRVSLSQMQSSANVPDENDPQQSSYASLRSSGGTLDDVSQPTVIGNRRKRKINSPCHFDKFNKTKKEIIKSSASSSFVRFHIFCTHLQATYSKVDWPASKVQQQQLRQLWKLIDESTIPSDAVLVCGDFNVDRLSKEPDVQAAKNELLSNAEFRDILRDFNDGMNPHTFISNIDATTGDFVTSNLHYELSEEEFRRRNLEIKKESLDAVFFRQSSLGECLQPTSCGVQELRLDNPFGRASDHFGVSLNLTVS